MKKACYFIILTLLSILTGCRQDVIPELTILSQESYDVSPEGETVRLSFKTNTDWSIIINDNWIESARANGKWNQADVSITVFPNLTEEGRTANVTVKCMDLEKKITIFQDRKFLELCNDTIEIEPEEHDFPIDFLTNIDCGLHFASDWLSLSDTKSSIHNHIMIHAMANDSYDYREAQINISLSDWEWQSIKVIQKPRPALYLESDTAELDFTGGHIGIGVSSTDAYDITIPEEARSWVSIPDTKAFMYSNITLDVSENPSYECREAVIHIVLKDIVRNFTIRQQGIPKEPYILVCGDRFRKCSFKGEDIILDIRTNVTDIVANSSEWIVPCNRQEQEYSYSVTRNRGFDARDGEITFSSEANGISATVLIHQDVEPANYLQIMYSSSYQYDRIRIEYIPVLIGEKAYGIIDWQDGSDIIPYTLGLNHTYYYSAAGPLITFRDCDEISDIPVSDNCTITLYIIKDQ